MSSEVVSIEVARMIGQPSSEDKSAPCKCRGGAEQPLEVGEFGLLWGVGKTHPSRGTNDFSPLYFSP